jgi:hypothetical protein
MAFDPYRGGDPPATRREAPAPAPTRRESPEDTAGWSGSLLRLPESLRAAWRIERDLPGGGEADVVLVRDARGTAAVVKVYRRHISVDAEVARRLTELDRTYLVAPYQTGHENGRHWELMEYVPGGSLAEHVDPPATAMSGPDVVETVRQVAEALTELHEARITHSDLKPSNILIRRTSPLWLALSDFGLSKFLGDASKRFTQRAHTIAYAAPESFAGRFSPAQDWWALGMIVRQLATGEAPFAGLSEQVAMHELLVREVALDGIRDDRLRLLCHGLLVRDPDHRWTGTEVRVWLAGGSPKVYEASDVRAGRPLVVAGRTCWTRAEAARAFATEWDRARTTFLERIGTAAEPGEGWRLLRSWLEQFDEDVEQRIRLIDQVLTTDVPPDVRMVHLLRWLDPTLPPTYRGESMLPEHLAALATAAGSGDAKPAEIVAQLWQYRLLTLLAGFAGGAPLAAADRRWRNAIAQLDGIAAAPVLPQPARDALTQAAGTHRAALLRACADPGFARLLEEHAVAARARLPQPPPPWFGALQRVQDPAVALAVLAVTAVAEAEYARVAAERDRGRLIWQHEEAARVAGRPGAIGYAVAAAGVWALVMGGGAVGAGLISGTDASAGILAMYGLIWLANAAAEVAVAYQIGAAYHPRWSALSALGWLGRRAPDAFAYLRRAGNSVRALGAGAPVFLGIACCCGCLLIPTGLTVGGGLFAVATVITAFGHLGWALYRALRFNGAQDQRRRALQQNNPGGGRL